MKQNHLALFMGMALLSLALRGASMTADAATLPVPSEYPTIQAAINSAMTATSVDTADTILVSAGTYTENLLITGNTVIIKSVDGPNATIIDGGANGTVITIYGGARGVTFEGFTITNGNGSYGGGFYINDSTAIVRNCIITRNRATSYGGGAALSYRAWLQSFDSVFSENRSEYAGGGLAILTMGGLFLNDTRIENNSAMTHGGGIYSSGFVSNPNLHRCVVSGNTARYGGGFYSRGQYADARAHNSLIKDNRAEELGGAFYAGAGGGFVTTNSTIVNNSAKRPEIDGVDGGGAGYSTTGVLYVTGQNNIFYHNSSSLVFEDITKAGISYSDVQGGGFLTDGNIDADPLFADPAAGDYHLTHGSPCIDTGTDSIYSPGQVVLDVERTERPQLNGFDMGAYEYVQKDVTPPATTASLAGTSGTSGWYTSAVSVTLTATDDLSGVKEILYSVDGGAATAAAGATASFTIASDGVHTVTYSAVDNAGNVEAVKILVVQIDRTAPEISILTPADGAEYLLNQPVTASWTAADATSGLAVSLGTAPSGGAIDTATVGVKSFSVTATDAAGNQSTRLVAYAVRYAYSGVLAPLSPAGGNTQKLGTAVPVKFRLTDANGSFITTATAGIYVAPVVGGVVGTEVPGTATGGSATGNLFRYDLLNNQYLFNLSTKTLTTGTWQLRIALSDGTSKYVMIMLQ
jgi:predicted outer membrane repeat protein